MQRAFCGCAATTWWPPFLQWRCFASKEQRQRLRQLPHVLLSHANETFQEREKEMMFQCHTWSFVSTSMERTKQRGHHKLFKIEILGHHIRESHFLKGQKFWEENRKDSWSEPCSAAENTWTKQSWHVSWPYLLWSPTSMQWIEFTSEHKRQGRANFTNQGASCIHGRNLCSLWKSQESIVCHR